MDKAYSYIRFSSEKQGKGGSVARQKGLRDDWLARNPAVELDTQLTMTDLGVSAFRGKHRDDAKGLGAFLKAVERGRIARGSYLVVENLDRLSREKVRKALAVFLNLIDKGIRIVQLSPVEFVYDESATEWQLMQAIVEMSRAHSESVNKSRLVSIAWAARRDSGRVVTSRTPGWLTVKDQRIVKRPYRVSVVRKVFRMCVNGRGAFLIAKTLNADNVPCFGKAKRWGLSSVRKLLNNRAVLGEYIPTVKGKRVEPIRGYYPRIIDDETFARARASQRARFRKGGKIGRQQSVFAGLLKDARSGSNMTVRSGARGGLCLVPYAEASAKVGRVTSFPLHVFEAEVLRHLSELKRDAVFPPVELYEERAEAIAERRKALLAQRELLLGQDWTETERMKARDIDAELANLGDAETPPELNIDPAEADRLRLRGAVRSAVESITCLFVGRASTRAAIAEVQFKGLGGRVDVLIVHKRKHKHRGEVTHSTRSAGGVVSVAEFPLEMAAEVEAMWGESTTAFEVGRKVLPAYLRRAASSLKSLLKRES